MEKFGAEMAYYPKSIMILLLTSVLLLFITFSKKMADQSTK
jgi:hypothetical protein